jgi:dTDP-4-dehydrorhamnose reductase
MRVVVTGAGGMLGREVVETALDRGHEVARLTHEDLDITIGADVDYAVAHYRPAVVINCAAWTDVDGAEADEAGATRVNDHAAGLVATAAASVGAKVIHLSTDYVFDGARRRPYFESDLPAPQSAYGRSKLAGETSVAVLNRRHMIVRTAWLFGHGRNNFVETMLRAGAEQPEVLVASDQVSSPTYTRHLAMALARLAEGERFGIHHIVASGHCSRFEWAQEIFDQAGIETRVMAATSEMFATPARRPAYSVLGSEHPDAIALPDWRRGLAEYLAERRRSRGEGSPSHAGQPSSQSERR